MTYTTKDGLSHEAVTRIFQNSRGFLWIGGPIGLTRFDGERFRSYGRPERLDVATGVNAIDAGAGGEILIATNGNGLFRFDVTSSGPAPRFKQFRIGETRASNRVNAFVVTPDHRMWAGTDDGLFAGTLERGLQRVPLRLAEGHARDVIRVAGVAAMRKRAAAFGGNLTIDSAPGRGTQVRLTVKLRQSAR